MEPPDASDTLVLVTQVKMVNEGIEPISTSTTASGSSFESHHTSQAQSASSLHHLPLSAEDDAKIITPLLQMKDTLVFTPTLDVTTMKQQQFLSPEPINSLPPPSDQPPLLSFSQLQTAAMSIEEQFIDIRESGFLPPTFDLDAAAELMVGGETSRGITPRPTHRHRRTLSNQVTIVPARPLPASVPLNSASSESEPFSGGLRFPSTTPTAVVTPPSSDLTTISRYQLVTPPILATTPFDTIAEALPPASSPTGRAQSEHSVLTRPPVEVNPAIAGDDDDAPVIIPNTSTVSFLPPSAPIINQREHSDSLVSRPKRLTGPSSSFTAGSTTAATTSVTTTVPSTTASATVSSSVSAILSAVAPPPSARMISRRLSLQHTPSMNQSQFTFSHARGPSRTLLLPNSSSSNGTTNANSNAAYQSPSPASSRRSSRRPSIIGGAASGGGSGGYENPLSISSTLVYSDDSPTYQAYRRSFESFKCNQLILLRQGQPKSYSKSFFFHNVDPPLKSNDATPDFGPLPPGVLPSPTSSITSSRGFYSPSPRSLVVGSMEVSPPSLTRPLSTSSSQLTIDVGNSGGSQNVMSITAYPLPRSATDRSATPTLNLSGLISGVPHHAATDSMSSAGSNSPFSSTSPQPIALSVTPFEAATDLIVFGNTNALSPTSGSPVAGVSTSTTSATASAHPHHRAFSLVHSLLQPLTGLLLLQHGRGCPSMMAMQMAAATAASQLIQSSPITDQRVLTHHTTFNNSQQINQLH